MIWLLGIAAFLGATISGVAGIGGGTLLIAVMFALGMSPLLAIPLHAAVQLVSNASRAVAYREHIDWKSVGLFSLTCVPLPFIVAPWLLAVDVDWIRLLIALAIFFSLVPGRHVQWGAKLSVRSKMLCAGALNGAIGMLIGATGLVIGPFFLDRNWAAPTTVGTLAVCQSIGHGLKILAFGALGVALQEQWDVALPLMLAVALGTVLGRWLMNKVSKEQFLRLFRLILFCLGLRLGYKAVVGLLL